MEKERTDADATAADKQEELRAQKEQEEREKKERMMQDRLDRRAAVLCGCIRKFLAVHALAAKEVLLLRAQAKLEKGKKKKKKDKKDDKAGGKDKKKAPKNPLTEAWKSLFDDLDEKINKNKRCSCNDFFRAVSKLEVKEAQMLAAITATVVPKKTFKGINMNEPILVMKNSLFAATMAFDHHREKVHTASVGVEGVRAQGLSARQALDLGYGQHELLQASYNMRDVVQADPDLLTLHKLGASATSLAQCGVLQGREGWQGAQALRHIGYQAHDLASVGMWTCWELRRAGFSHEELESAGFSEMDLTAAGFAHPWAQPTSFQGPGLRPAQGAADPAACPSWLTRGTSTQQWQRILMRTSSSRHTASSGPRRKTIDDMRHRAGAGGEHAKHPNRMQTMARPHGGGGVRGRTSTNAHALGGEERHMTVLDAVLEATQARKGSTIPQERSVVDLVAEISHGT